jgi:thiol-disulfide isomerase/thioredoxin
MTTKISHYIILITIVAIVAMYSVNSLADSPPKGIIVLDPKPAPRLKLHNMDGESFDLADIRGRWAFVHFWASWCGPCRKEMPTIQTMAQRLADSGLEIVMVNTAETDDTVFSFMGIVAPDLTPLMDYDGLVTEAWQPRGLPSTYLVDPHGQLRYLALGGRPWDKTEYIRFLERIVANK